MNDSMLILNILLGVIAIASVAMAFIINFKSTKDKDILNDKITKLEIAKTMLNDKVIELSTRKAALESRLSAQMEIQRAMEEERERTLNEQKEMNAKALADQKAQNEKALEAQKEQHARDLEHMKDTFKVLTAENTATFKTQSAESITELLKPIQEKFSEFDRSVRDSQEKSVEQNASLRAIIEQVMAQSKTVGEEAKNLANALTGYSKVQGDYGEMLLTDVLTSSGLTEGIHFITQGVITDQHGHEVKSETGATMIPDVIVYYPDDTIVIIDSKVSLTSYNRYMNSESTEERRKLAKEFITSVRNHVDELKKKNYASYVPQGKTKVNYNIMFIPMEGAFRLMLEEDPMLWQAAKNNNVLIVSQMTLTIVLNMIQMSWRQFNQEKNIAEVYKTAEELMSQLKGWMDSYVEVGRLLEKARGSYDDSKRKLLDSNQSVIKKIGKLEKLGIGPKRSNAKIKTGSRMMTVQESIIPIEFTDINETDQI